MSFHRRQLRRIDHIGHARYLTCSCYRRLPLLGHPRIRDVLAEQLNHLHQQGGFHLYAWVIMPEHFHLLILPKDGRVSVFLRRLKAPLAKQVIQRWRHLNAKILTRLQDTDGVVRFWQRGGGYDRNLIDGSELATKIDYIHANPVRRRLVNSATEWKWSSARQYAGLNCIGPEMTNPLT